MADPYGKYNGNELKYVAQFLEGDSRRQNFVQLLERAFVRLGYGKYAIAVNSGTSALHAALVACDVAGGEVLMPALCPAMVAFAIIHAGATPVFCDVDAETHHISPTEIAHKVTPKTRAILGVSLHGLPIDWAQIRQTLFDINRTIFTIDDCAQALGARGIGKADIICFSFEDKKHITTGSEGGMIATNNAELAMKARKFGGLGYKHMTAELGRTSLAAATYQDPGYERFDTIGLNYRMSQIQAAVGLGQLERLEHIVARRRAVALMIANACGVEHEIEGPHSYYTYPWSLPAITDFPWKRFYNRFVSMGGDGFYAMPQVPYKEPALKDKYWDGLPFKAYNCAIAEDLQSKLMLFKTNYRNLGEAERQAEILTKLIGEL